MAYPSIISQPGASHSPATSDIIDHLGSADRNYSPISEALRPWITESTASSSSASAPSSELSASNTPRPRARILEIGSYPYAHIKRFAEAFGEVHWYGSGRDEWEVKSVVRKSMLIDCRAHPTARSYHRGTLLIIYTSLSCSI